MLKTNLKDSNQKLEKYKIKKSSRGFKLKNDNGQVIIFIYYCSTPRSVCIYDVIFTMKIEPFFFYSYENKRSIRHMFWIDPISIQYSEKAT